MEEYREANANHHVETCPYCKKAHSLHIWPKFRLAHCANNGCDEFTAAKIHGRIDSCPYCNEEELVVWPEENIAICDNDGCNFGMRTIDEYEELEGCKYTDERIDIVKMMEERSAVEY